MRPQKIPNKGTEVYQPTHTVGGVDEPEVRFENPIETQMKEILFRFNILGSTWDREDREKMVEEISFCIQNFEDLLSANIMKYGIEKFNEKMGEMLDSDKKKRKKIQNNNEMKREDRPYELLNVKILTLRKWWRLLIVIGQSDQSEYTGFDYEQIAKEILGPADNKGSA